MFDLYNSSITSKPLMDEDRLSGFRSSFAKRTAPIPRAAMAGSPPGTSAKVQSALGGAMNQMFGSANRNAGNEFERDYSMANTQNLLNTEQARANSGLRGYQFLSNQNAQDQQNQLQQRSFQQQMMQMLTPYL